MYEEQSRNMSKLAKIEIQLKKQLIINYEAIKNQYLLNTEQYSSLIKYLLNIHKLRCLIFLYLTININKSMKAAQSPTKSLGSSRNSTIPNIQSLITNPIPQSQYPNLQLIIKSLNDYVAKSIKKGEYLQAQKAKQKIQQAEMCLKNRNDLETNDKIKSNMQKLQEKQDKEREKFIKDWEAKIKSTQDKFNDQIDKKKKIKDDQIMKARNQVGVIQPISFSPKKRIDEQLDQRLKSLKYELKNLTAQRRFVQAQRIKDEIKAKEVILEEKQKLMREENIKAMVQQLQQKHQQILKQILKQKKSILDDMIRQRNKKVKEMEDRHNQEIKDIFKDLQKLF